MKKIIERLAAVGVKLSAEGRRILAKHGMLGAPTQAADKPTGAVVQAPSVSLRPAVSRAPTVVAVPAKPSAPPKPPSAPKQRWVRGSANEEKKPSSPVATAFPPAGGEIGKPKRRTAGLTHLPPVLATPEPANGDPGNPLNDRQKSLIQRYVRISDCEDDVVQQAKGLGLSEQVTRDYVADLIKQKRLEDKAEPWPYLQAALSREHRAGLRKADRPSPPLYRGKAYTHQ